MSDKYVSQEAIKNALVDKFKARIGSSHVPTWNDAFDAVTNLPPAADVVEVRHASWIEDGYYGEPCVCSYCGEPCKDTVMGKPSWHYCPSCGAKMDGGQEDG